MGEKEERDKTWDGRRGGGGGGGERKQTKAVEKRR